MITAGKTRSTTYVSPLSSKTNHLNKMAPIPASPDSAILNER